MSFAKIYSVLCTAAFAFGTFALSPAAYGSECPCGRDEVNTEETAYRLVHNFWRAVKYQNVEEYSRLLAPGFQGLNLNGHYNREEQISGLENLTLRKFRIKDLVASRYGDTLVISYNIFAKGEGFTPGPSIDIWHCKNNCWKQVSHSYVPFPEPVKTP